MPKDKKQSAQQRARNERHPNRHLYAPTHHSHDGRVDFERDAAMAQTHQGTSTFIPVHTPNSVLAPNSRPLQNGRSFQQAFHRGSNTQHAIAGGMQHGWPPMHGYPHFRHSSHLGHALARGHQVPPPRQHFAPYPHTHWRATNHPSPQVLPCVRHTQLRETLQPTMTEPRAPAQVNQHIIGTTPSLLNYFQQQHSFLRQHVSQSYGVNSSICTPHLLPVATPSSLRLAPVHRLPQPPTDTKNSLQDGVTTKATAKTDGSTKSRVAQLQTSTKSKEPGVELNNEPFKSKAQCHQAPMRAGPSLTMRHPVTGNRIEPGPPPAASPEFEQMIANIQRDLQQAGERFRASSEAAAKPSRKRKTGADSNTQKKRRRVIAPLTSSEGSDQEAACTPTPKRIRAPLTPERKEQKRAYNNAVRSSPEYRKAENEKRTERYTNTQKQRKKKDIDFYIDNFQEKTALGPVYICVSCDRLCYRHAVINGARLLDTNTPKVALCAIGPISAEGKKWLCHTCNRYLKDGRVPPMALVNGNKFPEKPPHLDLHQLEWRLVAPRLVFMKIHQAPRGRQFKIEGNVVNVIADVANTVSELPRRRNNTDTIPVKLKRNLLFKNHTLSQNVRPEKVREAAYWLTQNGPLFQEQGITFHNLLTEPSNIEEPAPPRNLKRKLLDELKNAQEEEAKSSYEARDPTGGAGGSPNTKHGKNG